MIYLKGVIYSFTELKRVANQEDFKTTIKKILNCIKQSPCISKAELTIPYKKYEYALIIEQIRDNDFTFRLISIDDRFTIDRYSTALNPVNEILSKIEFEIMNYKPITKPKPESPNAL